MATGNIPVANLVNSRTPVVLNSVTGGKTPVAVDGDYLANDGYVRLAVYNPEADTLTLTITMPAVDGSTPPAKVITVAADNTILVGPFPVPYYGASVKIVCSFGGSGVLANVILKSIKF